MRNFPTAARNKAGIGAYERTGQSRSDVGLLFELNLEFPQNEMVKHRQIYHGAQCKIAFAECVLNDEQNQGIRACSDAIVYSLKRLSKENKKLQVSYGETLTISD